MGLQSIMASSLGVLATHCPKADCLLRAMPHHATTPSPCHDATLSIPFMPAALLLCTHYCTGVPTTRRTGSLPVGCCPTVRSLTPHNSSLPRFPLDPSPRLRLPTSPRIGMYPHYVTLLVPPTWIHHTLLALHATPCMLHARRSVARREAGGRRFQPATCTHARSHTAPRSQCACRRQRGQSRALWCSPLLSLLSPMHTTPIAMVARSGVRHSSASSHHRGLSQPSHCLLLPPPYLCIRTLCHERSCSDESHQTQCAEQ